MDWPLHYHYDASRAHRGVGGLRKFRPGIRFSRFSTRDLFLLALNKVNGIDTLRYDTI